MTVLYIEFAEILLLELTLCYQLFILQFQLFFSNYLRSDVYMKYLNELVSTVNIAHHTTTQTDVKHKRTGMLVVLNYLLPCC